MASDRRDPEIIPPRRADVRRAESTVVVSRNGRTTVLTGWRARLAVAGGSLLLAAAVVLGGIVLLGLAVTLATYLLVAVPLGLVVMAVWMMLSPRR